MYAYRWMTMGTYTSVLMLALMSRDKYRDNLLISMQGVLLRQETMLLHTTNGTCMLQAFAEDPPFPSRNHLEEPDASYALDAHELKTRGAPDYLLR